MDERGLWELFCATGLPEAYLALVKVRETEQVQTAFRPTEGERQKV